MLAILNSLNAHNFPIFEPILMILVSKQGHRYHKVRNAFSKFYHRHSDFIVKYNIGFKLFCNKAYQNLYFMAI